MAYQTQKISAVFDSDLERVLTNLGIYDAVIKGEINCIFCNSTITLSNLAYIFSQNGKIVINCSNSNCIDKIKSKANDAI